MRTGTMFGTVAAQEIRRTWLNQWSRLALIFVFAYSVVSLGNLYTLSQRSGDLVHTKLNFIDFLDEIRWAALILGAVMAGPALLEDKRRGALDLYYSRAVTPREYLVGKVLAVFGVTTFALFLPAFLYWATSWAFFQTHPEGWELAIFGALAYSIMWGLLVSGLGLGLSSIARSSVAATIILLGAFVVLEVVVSKLLSGITADPTFQILSPFSAVTQQTTWLFDAEQPFQFEVWWGFIEWLALVLLGWGLVWWRHPRVRGEDVASD